jgi:hypothetical protein
MSFIPKLFCIQILYYPLKLGPNHSMLINFSFVWKWTNQSIDFLKPLLPFHPGQARRRQHLAHILSSCFRISIDDKKLFNIIGSFFIRYILLLKKVLNKHSTIIFSYLTRFLFYHRKQKFHIILRRKTTSLTVMPSLGSSNHVSRENMPPCLWLV